MPRIAPAIAAAQVAFMVGLSSACAAPRADLRQPRALIESGDYTGAERAAARGLKHSPGDRALWRLKMESIQRQGDHRRAADAYLSWHKLQRHYDNTAIHALAVGVLREAAGEADPAVRAQALSAIRRFDPAPLRGLSRAALDDLAPRVRARAASAVLGRTPRAREILVELARSPEPGVRAICVRALGRVSGTRAVIDVALGDVEPSVRRAAVQALGRRGGSGAVERLLGLARDSDGTVRAEALSALTRSRDGRRISLAIAALDDDYLGARLAAIRVLALDRDRRGKLALVELSRSTDAYVALRASVVLKAWGLPVTDDAISRALGDRRWNVRVAALNAVAEVSGRDTALELVSGALVDERIEVQLAAARVLLRLGDTGRASETFYTALEAGQDHARIQGALGLVRMDDDGGQRALFRFLRSPRPETRAAAATALAQTRTISLPLVAALGDPQVGVRIAAASTLLGLGKRTKRIKR